MKIKCKRKIETLQPEGRAAAAAEAATPHLIGKKKKNKITRNYH